VAEVESESPIGQVKQRAELAPGFQEIVHITGHDNPVGLRFLETPPGTPVRAIVYDQHGRIYYYSDFLNQTSIADAQLVADLSDAVFGYWDRGLLGVAAHPDFPNTPEIYALYAHDEPAFRQDLADQLGYVNQGEQTSLKTDGQWKNAAGTADDCLFGEGGCVVHGRLTRLTVNLSDLRPATTVEDPLIEGKWCQQFPSHSTGDLHFGADGMLYATAGEGASFNAADHGQEGGAG
jgi:glucose/arabinose dehydrogenase